MRLFKFTACCALAAILVFASGCASGQASSSSAADSSSAVASEASSTDAADTPSTSSPAAPDKVSSTSEVKPLGESADEAGGAAKDEATLAITVNGTTLTAAFEDNSSAAAFADLLRGGPVTVSLHDYGNFEKVGPLPRSLPTNDAQITTEPGDVILYQGDQVTIYYDQNTWNFTRLAHIDDATRESLLSVLGDGDVEATFSLA